MAVLSASWLVDLCVALQATNPAPAPVTDPRAGIPLGDREDKHVTIEAANLTWCLLDQLVSAGFWVTVAPRPKD